MTLEETFRSFMESLGESLPTVLGAIAILVVGWIVALVVRAGLRKVLGALKVDHRVQEETGRGLGLERGISQTAYFVILILAFVAFLNALNLELVSQPLQNLVDQFFQFLPQLIGAAILFVVAWLIATVLRRVIRAVLSSGRFSDRVGPESASMAEGLANVVYWLVFLLFLPAILDALDLAGLLEPVQSMVASLLDALPRIFAALVIGLVGWFVARLVRDIVSNLLMATSIDRLGERAGMTTPRVSQTIAVVAYVLVLVPSIIAALNALQIEAIADPATAMLGTFMDAIPRLLAAAAIVIIAWFVARFVAGILQSLLSGIGFDRIPAAVGVAEPAAPLSRIASQVARIAIVLFAIIEAADQLEFAQLSELLTAFLEFGGQVLLGVVIIGLGVWLASLAHRALQKTSTAAVANIVRLGVLGLVLAMGLRAMGLADEIVNMAFGLTLGSVAVAFALAFGLGGRSAAATLAERWVSGSRRRPTKN